MSLPPEVEASTNQVIDLPRNDLPWKILCRVINVQLKAEADTDEVFAQVTVLPEPNVSLVSFSLRRFALH